MVKIILGRVEALGPYWLRRILLRMDSLTLYEAQDTRTGLPVFFLQNPQGIPLEAEGVVPLSETLPKGWVLEKPRGAVPLSAYLGVADPERLLLWAQRMRHLLSLYQEKGVRYAPRPELTLVKGRRVWFLGVGAKAFEGDPEEALRGLLLALAGEREAVLKEVEAFLSSPEASEPVASRREESPPEPEPVVEVVEEPHPTPPSEELPLPPSRPKVIRIEERDEPPFEPISPPSRRGRRWGLGVFLLLFATLFLFWFLRPKGEAEGPYRVEFRLDPPGGGAELFLLEAPPASKMEKGASLGRAPGWVEFDAKGVYRIRIRVPGRDPVDYLLEVPSPPVTIKVK